jgi:hypothetical protein
MHYIALINFPFNGLFLLLMVEMAHVRREDLAFGPASFMVTFFLSVGVITFTGAILDGLLIFSDFVMLIPMAGAVGLVAALVVDRYLGLSRTMAAVTMVSFIILNILVWVMIIAIARMGVYIDEILESWWYLLPFYGLLVVLAAEYAMRRLRTTQVVTVSPYTGEKGLERLDRGPVWEQMQEVLGRRTLNELLALCLVTSAIAVLVPLMFGTTF